MNPTIIELNSTESLIKTITTADGKTLSEITLKQLIIRPGLKRIAFITEELDRVIIYQGEELFEAHKNDSESALKVALLKKINADYNS